MQQTIEDQGQGTNQQKRIWMDWVHVMTDRIIDLKAKSPGSRTKQESVIADLVLSPELTAVITCQTVLNNLFLPGWRRKSNLDAKSAQAMMDKEVDDIDEDPLRMLKFAKAVVSVGEAVRLENMWREAEKAPAGLSEQIGRRRRMTVPMMAAFLRKKSRAQTDEEALKSHIVPIGATLVDMMVSCATVKAHNGLRLETVPAFKHNVVREGKKQTGYLELHASATSKMDLMQDDTMSFLAPKHQPMIVPPRPWRPGADNPEGGYLLHKVAFIRTSNQKATHLKVYDTRRVADVMDSLGSVRWNIHPRILSLMEKAWSDDLNLAGIPAVADPDVEELSDNFEELPADEQKSQKLRRFNATKQRAELRSERPTFQFKINVARDFEHAEAIYFPHNIDFRGRAYPIPPHLNHIGDDVCRGLLKFADPKPLGKEGFFWLKISLANLLGKDKLPFQERIDYIDASKDWILKVAVDPLHEDSRQHWVDAPDGPWQALARILEIAECWQSGDEENFLSCQPVHMDGSCNGLQHYAALGRDEEGGRAVNLTPSDRPQDVYSIVLVTVKQKVQKDAESEPDPSHFPGQTPKSDKLFAVAVARRKMARQLQDLNLLQRKVVKQTIMTICYGVTAIGAKDQVQRQIIELVGKELEPKEISLMAQYLSQIILKSIDEVFERAMRIKSWFDKVSQCLNQLQVPVQWFSPVGLACTQPYRVRKMVKVKTKLQSVSLAGRESPKVDKAKQRMGFPPNFVHSLDAAHMMMVAEGCREHGISFAGVHDSFWTHAADAPVLSRLIREKFYELHSRPILEEIDQDIRLHLGSFAHKLPPLPQQSNLDLEQVKDSLYMFD